VPIKTISTFKRMRELQPHGQDFVTLALRRAIEAEGSDPLLAVSEDGQNVRRVRSLEPDTTAWSRSAYIVSIRSLLRAPWANR
jgi:lupus La protein